MRFSLLALLCCLSLLSACQSKKSVPFSALFSEGVSVGKLNNPAIDEASGLDASVANSGMYWTHNDSGGEPRLFLIDDKGNYQGSVLITTLQNRDWEDIAVGPGPDPKKSYVYIGEIGDNEAVYEYKYIYRIEEPSLSSQPEITLSSVDSIKFNMPDGPRDTEAIFIDQQSNDLYIFSKREKQISLYMLPYPQATDAPSTALRVATLPLTQIVAADYEAATRELLIKNYDSVYYWKRGEQETIADMIKRKPEHIRYTPEPQGESVCFRHDGTGFYTLSEKKREAVPLLFYKRTQMPSKKY
jgi:hypothetical protein